MQLEGERTHMYAHRIARAAATYARLHTPAHTETHLPPTTITQHDTGGLDSAGGTEGEGASASRGGQALENQEQDARGARTVSPGDGFLRNRD